MDKERYRPEEIIGQLREADVFCSQGKKVMDVIKALGITNATYYRWWQEFGGEVGFPGHASQGVGDGEQAAPGGGQGKLPSPSLHRLCVKTVWERLKISE